MARFDCNGTAVASGYGFFLGRRLFYYQSGFDPAWSPHGVSAILLAYIMEDAIERLGATEFDFLRGQENYKYFWTDVNRKTEGLFLWGRSPRARVAEAEFTVRRRLSRVRMQFEKWTAIIKKKLQSNA
jgi:CelD/BcsL family acetyltransferase involved in cellulose biosynthesis